ncbi:MAG: HAD-IB family phosphatase [Bacteroidia bacterium]|nr:HAD-IB family phosphatase [Bacteroidia bacterium]
MGCFFFDINRIQMKPTYYFFDFDSTFTQVEAMEELAEISLAGNPELDIVLEKIKQLTDLAMDGKMPFGKSLKARIALLSAKKYHIQMLVKRLRLRVSKSFSQNKQFFKNNKGNIYIVSGGFKEFIVPIVKSYHIDADHVFANTFTYDKKGNIIGADEGNYLSQEQGKVKFMKSLNLDGKKVFVGDGFTDLEVYEHGLANQFFAYTENVYRDNIVRKAPATAASLDEILYSHKQAMSVSFPKSRIKVVLWGEETFVAETNFRKESYRIIKLPATSSITEFNSAMEDAQLLVFGKHVNTNWITDKSTKLMALATWDHDKLLIKNEYFSSRGLPLYTAPMAHMRSLTELALLHMLTLTKRLKQDLFGKTLGIIGNDYSTQLLAITAANIGMNVLVFSSSERPILAHVKYVNSIPELTKKSHIICIFSGHGLAEPIGKSVLKNMLSQTILLYFGSDQAIDLDYVKHMLQQRLLAGFGMDASDKSAVSAFKNLPAFISINESTASKETQINIADTLSKKLIDFVNSGNTVGAINFPELSLPPLKSYHRLIHIHENKPGVLSKINALFAKHAINVGGQYLQTKGSIGYVITDISKTYQESIIRELKSMPETIKIRVLY